MAQPSQATQELPAWLSYSYDTFYTDGIAYSTSSTLLHLPLTYYGPSIPLGTDGSWAYGGLSSPGPTPTPSSASEGSTITSAPTEPTTLPVTSSAIPSSETQIPSSSAIPLTSSLLPSEVLSSLSPASSTETASSSSFSATPTPSFPPPPTPNSHLSRGAIAGIVAGAILGLVIMLFLLLCCLRGRGSRRNRRELAEADRIAAGASGRYDPVGLAKTERTKSRKAKWSDWIVIYPNDGGSEYAVSGSSMGISWRTPGRSGSPNLEGQNEHDHLLSRSTDGMQEVNSTARLVIPATAALAHPGHRSNGSVSGFIASHQSNHSRDSVNSNDSGFGSILTSQPLSSPLDPFSPFAGPNSPPLFYHDRGAEQPSEMRGTIISHQARARLEEEGSKPGPSGQGLPLYHSTMTGKLSTVHEDPFTRPIARHRPYSNPRHSGDTGSFAEPSQVAHATRVNVTELGPRSPPAEELLPFENAGPSSWVTGLGIAGLARFGTGLFGKSEGERPRSYPGQPTSYSSRNGSSSSRRPSSYVGIPEDQGTLLSDELKKRRPGFGVDEHGQRPMSSVSGKSAKSGATTYHSAISNQSLPMMEPSSRTSTPLMEPASNPGSRAASPYPLIDLSTPPRSPSPMAQPPLSPPPAALSPTSVDILDSPAPRASERFAARDPAGNPFYPPGLFQPQAGDVLEDEPPRAADAWASMGGSPIFNDPSRRMTFGAHPRHLSASEQGSLRSLHSHLSPYTNPSAPGSRRALEGSMGSNSSRGHSQGRSASSGGSLAHSGSVSSDSHRRHGPTSPSLSAFGTQGRASPASHTISHYAPQPQTPSRPSFDQTYGTVNLNEDLPLPETAAGRVGSPRLPFDAGGSAIGWWDSPPRRSGPTPVTTDQNATK